MSIPVARWRGYLLAGLVSVALGTPGSSAQEQQRIADLAAQQPAEPQEVAALDALVQSLLAGGDASTVEPQNLIELSRLLSVPCDQLLWLGRQIAALEKQPETARQLADLAGQRAQQMASLLADCAEGWPEWIRPAAPPAPPPPKLVYELTDPAELKERLAQASQNPEELYALAPHEKFALLARGCEDQLVFRPREQPPDWNAPHTVLDQLARGPQSPAFWELRSLQQRLAAAHDSWTRSGAAQFGEPESQSWVEDSFAVTAALLDRALGLDHELAQRAPTLPYKDDPAAWKQLAAMFEQQALKSWTALAYVLAASPQLGQPADPQVLAAARAAWQDFRQVNPKAWSAVDQPQDGWLARLALAERAVQAHLLPLAANFLAPQREQRRQHEDEVRALLRDASAGGDEAADRIFQAIERAKAAELGAAAEIKPLSLPQLVALLGGEEPWVYLFVEMLELGGAGGEQPSVFAGVAVYRERYTKRTGGQVYNDKYVVRVLAQSPSPEALVAAALAQGPPAETTEARILIAPDGPLPPSWFDFEKTTLLPRTGGGIDPSWIVYLPSATALNSAAWTLDDTLRVWYRLGVRSGKPPLLLASDPQLVGARRGQPIERADMTMYLVSLAPAARAGDPTAAAMQINRLPDFMDAKRRDKLAVIPLWVSK